MRNKRLIAIGVIGLAAVLGISYTARSMHYKTRFLPKTQVLGVNIGGQTVDAASQELKQHFGGQKYQFTENNKTAFTASGKQLGLNRSFTVQLKQLLNKQNPWRFTAVVLAGTNSGSEVTLNSSDKKLTAYVQQTAAKLNPDRKAPQDAKLVDRGGKYVVDKEKPGDQISANRLKTAIGAAIDSGQTAVPLNKAYTQAKVLSTDKSLKTAVTKLENIAKLTAKLRIENQVVTIPKTLIRNWLGYQAGKVTINAGGVDSYVADLAKNYGTYGKKRTFKSTKRGTVTVPAGIYGWSIAQKETAANLTAAIFKGQSFTQEIVHQGSGYNAKGTDIGNTYVEVDIKNQHEYFYKDGKLTLNSPVVTGEPSGPTPKGVFYVWKKERNAVLKGKNDDGSKYASPVAYWMPIDYSGVGLHDSPWQPRYGGDWYKTHGSHGCVNNPPSFMKKLYEAVPLGTPVIVF